jgi:L-2-hydroxyglutarate oxidase
MPKHSYAVIGAGAVGLATAMALAVGHKKSVVVLEAEDRVARHQTGNNSGVIHSGLYYKPGSLKARLCAEGRDLLYQFCGQRNIPHERCGKLVVATDESQLEALEELYRRGQANGLQNIRRLNADQLRQYEPHVAGIAGLRVEETGIVDYKTVARAYADAVAEAGGEVRLNWRVKAVRQRDGEIIVQTTAGEVKCQQLINCAGLQSDRVARLCKVDPGVRIVPFRGEYYQLAPAAQHFVHNLIYPVPDPQFPFLGVHFTRMIGGGIEAGPNAVLALARHGYTRASFNPRDALATLGYPGFWRIARRFWRTGLGEFHRSFSKPAFLKALQALIPELTLADLQPGGAGVRAQALAPDGRLVDDFHIVQTRNMTHVLNAPSPAATASISIGKYVADLAEGKLEGK